MEYWIDYSAKDDRMAGMRMPVRYVVEMFIDRVCASKNYQKDKYTDESPLAYYEKGKNHYMLHPETKRLLEKLLHMLAEEGEERVYAYIRSDVLKKKKRFPARRSIRKKV